MWHWGHKDSPKRITYGTKSHEQWMGWNKPVTSDRLLFTFPICGWRYAAITRTQPSDWAWWKCSQWCDGPLQVLSVSKGSAHYRTCKGAPNSTGVWTAWSATYGCIGHLHELIWGVFSHQFIQEHQHVRVTRDTFLIEVKKLTHSFDHTTYKWGWGQQVIYSLLKHSLKKWFLREEPASCHSSVLFGSDGPSTKIRVSL